CDLQFCWAAHYGGSPDEERLQRHFIYSDRIRYYWPDPRASAAVGELFRRLPDEIPETLISQYLGRLYSDVVSKRVAPKARELCLAAIDTALAPYSGATANR
ncbi:class II D-tagatose-bisphosphate aldolase non-catalytic subunit, partial [Rhizobium ruizarguesonis]